MVLFSNDIKQRAPFTLSRFPITLVYSWGKIDFRSSTGELKVLHKMWNVAASHENTNFPYIPLFHLGIWTDNNNNGQLIPKGLLKWRESNTFQVCFMEMLQEVDQWTAFISSSTSSFKKYDGIVGRALSSEADGSDLLPAKFWQIAFSKVSECFPAFLPPYILEQICQAPLGSSPMLLTILTACLFWVAIFHYKPLLPSPWSYHELTAQSNSPYHSWERIRENVVYPSLIEV